MRTFRILCTLLAVWAVRPGAAFGQPWVVQGDPFAPDVATCPADDYDEYMLQLGVGHDIGEGIGYTNSFTTFEAFVPLLENQDRSLLFSDVRFLVNNEAFIGMNAGIGERWYWEAINHTFGVFAYYDFRETEFNTFHQLSAGFDILGPIVDVRGNVYVPDVADSKEPLPGRFVRNFLVARHQVAMTGVDIEVGTSLPRIGPVQPRVFGGYYHFEESGTPDVDGWRVRVEHNVEDTLYVDVSVQEDDVFGRTVVVGLALRSLVPVDPYPAPPYPPIRSFREPGEPLNRACPWRRLAEPVERLQNIVITEQEELARDPAGNPIVILHVAEGGAGDGTIENPYGTFADALADPRAPTSLVYTPFGGTFTEDVTLVPGATLLSNGPVQIVSTQTGPQQLPFSGTGTLVGLNGNLTLADNTTVSGFNIVGGPNTVLGDGISDVTLSDLAVTATGGNAVQLQNMTGSATLNRLNVASDANGIEVLDSDLSLSIADSTINTPTGNGVQLTNLAGTAGLNNLVMTTGGVGVEISDSAAMVALDSLTITGDGTSTAAVSIIDTAAGGNPANVSVTNSTLSGLAMGWAGIGVASENGGTFTFDGNTISGTTGTSQFGINIGVDGAVTGTPNVAVDISNNTMTFAGATPTAVNIDGLNGATINPLSGMGSTATDSMMMDLMGTELFNPNTSTITGMLEMNGMQVFP